MIKKDCFAYMDNREECNALVKLNCEKCSFYRHWSTIRKNPFYLFSWDSYKEWEEHIKAEGIDKKDCSFDMKGKTK